MKQHVLDVPIFVIVCLMSVLKHLFSFFSQVCLCQQRKPLKLRLKLQSRLLRFQLPSPECLYRATRRPPGETRGPARCSSSAMINQNPEVRDFSRFMRKSAIAYTGALFFRLDWSEIWTGGTLPSRAAAIWTSCGRGSVPGGVWRSPDPSVTERRRCWSGSSVCLVLFITLGMKTCQRCMVIQERSEGGGEEMKEWRVT